MIPILYSATETNFQNFGIGTLSDCTSCTVKEERNGVYECEFSYPITGQFYSEISPDRIVKVKANEVSDLQLFRVYRSTKPINGIVKFYCQHISYDLNMNIVEPFSETNINTVTALNDVLNHCFYSHRFTATSDQDTVSSLNITTPTSARSCLGGIRGSILDNFGGEYEFDNFIIRLYAHRGQDTGVTIRYGKNLTDVNADTSIERTYTSVYPYAVDSEENYHELIQKVIALQDASNYGEPRTLALNLSDKFEDGETITNEKLSRYAQAYITANDISKIKQSIDISFEQLWQTEEYKDIALLERVKLCDTVTVIYEALGVSVKAKVIAYEYDALKEKYTKMTLGDAKSNFADSLIKANSDIKEMSEEIKSAKSTLERDIKEATDLITGQTGGYIIFRNFTKIFDDQGQVVETKTLPEGQPAEMLIMDNPDVAQAVHVWRYNLSGWGYSSTGVNGPFRLAATSNGKIVADFISTGNLNASLLTTGTINADLIRAGTIKSVNNVTSIDMATGEIKISQTGGANPRQLYISNAGMLLSNTSDGSIVGGLWAYPPKVQMPSGIFDSLTIGDIMAANAQMSPNQLLISTSGSDKAKLAPNQLILTDANGTSAQMSVISNFLYSDTALRSKGFSVADSSNSQKGAFFLTGTGKSKLDSDIITAAETISAGGNLTVGGTVTVTGDISTSGNDKAKLAPNQLVLTDTNGTSAQVSVVSNCLYANRAYQSKGFSVADASNSEKGAFFLTGTGKSKLDADIITATGTVSADYVTADTVNMHTLRINSTSYVPTAITINGTSYTIPVRAI